MYNNPVNFTDPDGLWETDENGNQTTNKPEDIERFMSYVETENAINVAPNLSQLNSFIGEEKSTNGRGRLTNGNVLLSPVRMTEHTFWGNSWFEANKKDLSNMWYEVQGSLTPDALDPRTLHNNNFVGIPNGLTYAGPNDPKKYNGQDDYSYFFN